MSKIFINPGHCPDATPFGGMVDSGAVNENLGVTEAEIVRDIGSKLVEILEEEGHDIYLLQSDNLAGEDGYEYEDSVVCQSDTWNADYFISLHLNACNTLAKGTEVFFGSKLGARFAACVQKELIDTLDTVDRGTKNGEHLCVVRETQAVAILIEIAFVDNDEDCQKVLDNEDEIAQAIADGIDKFIESYGD